VTLPRPPYDPELGAFLEAQYAASPEPAAALSPGTLPGVREMLAAVSPSIDHAAELGIDPARVVIAGNSAGGGLAAATTLMARRAVPPAYRRTPAPARAADLSGLPPAYLDVGAAPVLRDEINDNPTRRVSGPRADRPSCTCGPAASTASRWRARRAWPGRRWPPETAGWPASWPDDMRYPADWGERVE
jgi:hypothetical protein